MKLIKPYTEILTPVDTVEVYKTIEKVARTCYKSEDKITDTSAERMVKSLIKSGHEAMIEFFDITVKFTCDRITSQSIVRHRLGSFAQESTRYVSSCEKKHISEFNCDKDEDVCAAYSQGFSMRQIALNSSNTEWEIRKILLAYNIPIRGLNNKGNRNEDYFKVIDTVEKAYLLGIIQSDGSIRWDENNKSYGFTITQHKEYSWYLENMLHLFSDYVCRADDKDCHQLIIGSKEMASDLIKLGIVPNKTYVQTDENINNLWNSVPEYLKGSFIRGLIDGDGYVRFFTQPNCKNESCQIGFCSVKESLVDLIIGWIENRFGYKPGKAKDGNVYKFGIYDFNKSLSIGDYLYEGFKYPFGHPKKASAWITRLKRNYEYAEYKDSRFKIIIPSWLGSCAEVSKFNFIKCVSDQEDTYVKFILSGLKPEQARQVLPQAIKTEINVKFNLREWRHFLNLRCHHTAHPDIRILSLELLDKFYKLLPVVFEDLYIKYNGTDKDN